MEIIEIGSYTSHEKFHIGKNHLIDEVLEEHGLDENQLQVDDEALKIIIEKYTREAGVRSLKRQLSAVARVASEKVVLGTRWNYLTWSQKIIFTIFWAMN